MKFTKFLLIIGIITLMSAFVVNTSYAANSEKITKFDCKEINVYNKKIVSIQKVSNFNEEKSSVYFKISVKNLFKNKYKIKSVQVKISEYNTNEYIETKTYNKTYEYKKKDIVHIKLPNSNNIKYYSMDKITIFYKTKSKFKNESTKFQKQCSSSSIKTFKGKRVVCRYSHCFSHRYDRC